MPAIVIDPHAPSRVRWSQVPLPRPRDDQALVEVEAAAINPGELASRLPTGPPGAVPGWESVGTVVEAARDGSGPRVGERVVSFGEGGAWAGFRSVSTATTGVLPADLDAVAAATLPVGAGSALRATRVFGGVIGKRLMITGATGSVGRYAVQLARLAGAAPVAVARNSDRHQELRNLGANEVVSSPTAVAAPVDFVLDTVGGEVLADAFRALRHGGILIPLGRSSGHSTTFVGDDFMADHGRSKISIRTFFMPEDLDGIDVDLTWLASLLRDGRLQSDAPEVIPLAALPDRLAAGSFGKLVARP